MKNCRSHFVRAAWTLLFLFLALISGISQSGQSAKDTGTDLQFHKFQPKVDPERAVTASSAPSGIDGIGQTAAQQILALQQDKAARTPAQKKIDSNLIYTMRMLAGKPVANGVPFLNTGVELDENDNLVVDMVANVTDKLLQQLTAADATVLYKNVSLRSIRAIIPPSQIEGIAASPDVIFISPKQNYATATVHLPSFGTPLARWALSPGFATRAANVRRQLAMLMSTPGTPITWQGSVGTEGDLTHQALDARGAFGVNGAGLKIGVLSDGVTSRALSQATGDLPPTCGTPPCLTVLAGQAGFGDEGTAMMEIIHDMVPGASLEFATADNSITSFAANIKALQAAGCQIIVDDVFYFVETPFQDGQTAAVVSTSQGGVVIQAVNDVVAQGVFYFSSAGNEGSLDAGTAGTYEGDFVPQAAAAPLPTGNVHNFGSGNGFDTITAAGFQVVGLWWADPLGGSGNDYDLYLLNGNGASILGASTNIQNGTQDPVELIGSANVINNNRLVVFQNTGAANRFFHLTLFRGGLAVATTGETHGHSAASGAYTVAATPAARSAGSPTPNGPFPGPFTSANQTEFFSSDGLRHIFFNGDSTAITPGNFSASGGTTLNKPDVTAADGVSVTGVGGFGSPFYGTSAAAPTAASVAALVLSAKPGLTAAQMRTALTSTAIDIMAPGFDRDAGSGIVMALPAVQSLGIPGNANPALATITANENPGNGNGIIERGEGASLSIQLKNTGGVKAATGVTATLTASTPGVIVTQPGTSAYADMGIGAVGGTNLSPFTFTLASSYPCGQTADFTLTVNFTGGTRVLNFSVPTGLLSITNTLGTTPPALLGLTTATGTQVNRISRNGVISACGAAKAFPGAIVGSHTFDSYTFAACQSFCMQPVLSTGAAGFNLFESAYTPSYVPNSIGTNYAGDAGLSTNIQSFGISTTAGTPYTIVVNDVAGNPPPPPAPPNTYTIQIPSCAFNCNVNHLPVAIAQNVSVLSGAGGTANANVDNGSFDPDGDPITISQIPPGPYPVGTNNVILTVVDSKGATAQANATATVVNSDFGLALTLSSLTVAAGQSGTEHITFTPNPGIGAPLTFSCSGLPNGATCSFSPNSVAAGSPQTDIALTITTTASSSSLMPPKMFYSSWTPAGGLCLIGFLLFAAPKRRRSAALLIAFSLMTLVLLAGCGSGSGRTSVGSFPVTVTGTSGTASHSQTFTLTVL